MKSIHVEIPKEVLVDNLILLGYRGSISHNTYIPSTDPDGIDDVDLMGIFLARKNFYIGLGQSKATSDIGLGQKEFVNPQTIEIMKDVDGILWDCVYYELGKFIKMLLKGNPNVINLLWIKPEHYILTTEYGEMLIKNRKSFLGKKYIYPSFTGYADGQMKRMTHCDFKGYMGEKRKRLVNKYGYDCYDEETTEFLTNSGWKDFDSINSEDKLGTVNIESNHFEFQNYQNRVDKLYTGVMYVVEPHLNKCIVTPNHNLLLSPAHRSRKNKFSYEYEKSKASWYLLPIEKAINGYKSVFHYRRTAISTNKDYDIDDSYLTLAGLYISDGTSSFRINKTNKEFKCIRITQTKSNNGFYDIVDSLMDVYPIKKYSYNKETVWVLHGEVAKQIYSDFGHRKNKHLADWCFKLSKRQVKLLWSNLLLGDGTKKKKYDVYYTTLNRLASDIQAMLTITGMFCTVNGPYISKTPSGNTLIYYHVTNSKLAKNVHSINFGKLLKYNEKPIGRQKNHPVKEIKVTNKRVVCFEVQNSTLITRNGGKVSIHGNCKNASHLIRLLLMGIEVLDNGSPKVFRDKDADMLIDIKTGKWPLEKVKDLAKELFEKAKESYDKSTLPDGPDHFKAEEIMMKILMSYLTSS